MATQDKSKKSTVRREAADKTTSPERLAVLAEESAVLSRVVAKNPSATVSLPRVLCRSEDVVTRKNVILNPFASWDILDELEDEFPEEFVNNPALALYNSIKL